MKKTKSTICIMLVLLILFLTACRATAGWQTATIYSYGTIKLPDDWQVTKTIDDGFMTITVGEDEDGKCVFVQYDSAGEVNPYFDDVEERDTLYGEIFSNSAFIAKEKFVYKDGTAEELFTLEFTEPKDLDLIKFVCVDKSVPEDTLREIAKSYVMAEK